MFSTPLFSFLAIQLSILSFGSALRHIDHTPVAALKSVKSLGPRLSPAYSRPVEFRSNSLVARARVPSTDELVAKIQESDKMGGMTPIFWSTFPRDAPYPEKGLVVARDWARARFGPCNIVMFDTCYTDKIFVEIKSNPLNTAQNEILDYHMSKAYARMVSGTVYLMVRDGLEPDHRTIWINWEFPVITRRGRVDKVIKVEWPSLVETTYWTKEDGVRGEPPPPGRF